MKCFSIVVLFSLFIGWECLAQEKNTTTIRLVFYNVENFFDTSDDTLRNDNDFLPHGIMRWNDYRYKSKINSIYKVISAAGEWDLPGIIGFCEVEKKSVLQDLVYDTYLNKYDWGIIHEESADPRGIDVCLIYRKDLVRLLSYRYIRPEEVKDIDFRSRSVLYSKLLFSDDTIHLFLNHWPSRRGGALAEESLRYLLSEMLKGKADSISRSVHGHAKIILAGDFNCTPKDVVISVLTGQKGNEKAGTLSLLNLSDVPAARGQGSYRFKGVWEMLDQVIVSDWFTGCTEGYYCDAAFFRVFNPGFLMRREPAYPGLSPFSTYKGYRYQGGFSDHLPVILDMKRREVTW